MKKTLFFLIMSLFFISGYSQIYAPEGLNMPGSWNTWTNPPTNLAIASSTQVTNGRVTKITIGTARYQTVFSVAASGADFTGNTYAWVFTSGATGTPFANKWGGASSVTTVIMNTLQTYTHGTVIFDNSITLTNGKWYTMNWKDAGYANTSAIFMETSAAPVDITTVAQSPLAANVFPGQTVTINITASATLAAEEKVYVRYSTNDFSSSALVLSNFVGTAGTATIPALTGTVKYYVFSTTVSNPSSDFDLYTIKLNNNGGSNYSYTVASSWLTALDGNWSATGTWQGGVVPISGFPVTIANNVTLDQNATISSLTINSDKTFTASDATPRTLTISTGGTLSNSGTFTRGTGTVTFPGTGTVSGTVGFNNVTLAGGVNFGASSTINGTLTINANGFVSTSPPVYATGSNLTYNSNTIYGRGSEWSATSGLGYPANVVISNNTTLNMGANSGTGTARQCAGNLTIDAGSAFSMNETGNVMTAAVTVSGNISNSGTITLSGTAGGDLNIKGNWLATGTFNHNTRAVTFNGTSTQEISSGATTFGYLIIDNAAGVAVNSSGLITVANDLTINSGKLLTINAGKSLTVTGTLTNSAGNSGLVIESGGSLLNNTVGVNVTVKREITSNSKWHFLSSPVSAQNICDGNFAPLAANFDATTGATYDFFKWSELLVSGGLNWLNLKQTNWSPNTGVFGTPPVFAVSTGYLVNYSVSFAGLTTKSFAGPLNAGDQTVTLSKSSGGNAWNLVGNPFPSSIDWAFVTGKDTYLDNAYYYIYNEAKSGGAGYENYSTGNIAPMQGFFVKAKAAGAIGFPFASRVHGGTWLKNVETSPVNQLTVKLSKDAAYDEASILFSATGSINAGWYDADKLFSMDAKIPQVYTLKDNDQKICINSMPYIKDVVTVPVGMYIPSDGNYSLKLSGFESFPSLPGIMLEDLKTNATMNMVQTPVYAFSASKTDDPNRFLLHFAGAIGINEKPGNDAFRFFASDNSLVVIDNIGKAQGTVYVYNMMGQLMVQQKLTGSNLTKISLNTGTGYYLIKVVTGNNVCSGKVFINN